MECKKANILFDEYINNQLNPQQLNSMRMHLENCQACNAALNAYKEVVQFIQRDRQLDENIDLFASIEDQIKVKTLSKDNSLFKSTITYVAASIVLLLSVLGGHLIGNAITGNNNAITSELSLSEELFAEDLNLDFFNEK